MLRSQIPEILTLISSPKDLVTLLQESSFHDLPKWSDLVKEFDPLKHSIITDINTYPPKINEKGQDEFKRTPLALQKLAVNRLVQSMFATPVTRMYDYDRENEQENLAVDILENIYRVKNDIDGANIERGKKLHGSCQMATIWRAYDKPLQVKGQVSNISLTHTTYSPMDGYDLYPQVDEFGDLIVMSIGYTDSSDLEHFDVYIGGEQPAVVYLVNESGWKLSESITENPKRLEFFPVTYAKVYEPAWGGKSGTLKVEQLEEMESFDGLYIKKNSAPAFTLDYGELPPGSQQSDTKEKSDDSRKIIPVGKGGGMKDVSWTGAGESLDKRIKRLRNAFFEEIQIPDTSFENMIGTSLSADNRELVFSDARQKAIDLGGEWNTLFRKEMEIVTEFAKIMFPSLRLAFENISVRSVIKPYSVKSDKDKAEFVANAGSSMSMQTKVEVLDVVSDVDAEVRAIQEELSASANQGFNL